MLRSIRVTHLAVIESVDVEFEPGLNVLTGETGAGKSILVEAVSLLLGGRASGDLVRTGQEMATVEAIFETGHDEILVRREISAQGRSRAFVNGALATAGTLKDLSAQLIELHGQHEHQTLLDPDTHLGVLDAFAQLEALAAPVRARFEALRSADDALTRARAAMADRESRQDLLTYQVGELERAALKENAVDEDADLARERRVLSSAERMTRLCEESYEALYNSDASVLAGLGGVFRRVGELAAIDPAFQLYVDNRDGIKSQLEELANFLRRYAEGVAASPARQQEVEERLALLERLKRKYGPTLSDVIARQKSMREELDQLQRGDARIGELEVARDAARAAYLTDATTLSHARRTAGKRFARELESLLAELAMERTRFDVRFESGQASLPESTWSATGIDAVEFFVSPNVGEDLRPLARIVSGGELSRIMLAIKTLTFRARLGGANDRTPGAAPPGLIFDEVDAGIGGRVADVVGRKLQELGARFQVLCITHLPQIAAYADTHFQIEKGLTGNRTSTTVRRLNSARRVEELARMMGGAALTDGLRASAREMLEDRAPRPASTSEAKGKGESERAKAKGRRGA